MTRAVLDANIIISALLRPQGHPGRILKALMDGHFTLIVTETMLDEWRRAALYPRVLKYCGMTPVDITATINAIEWLSEIAEGTPLPEPVCRDPDDDKYLSAALSGRADVIVSGDKDLLDLREYECVKIISARRFVDELLDE